MNWALGFYLAGAGAVLAAQPVRWTLEGTEDFQRGTFRGAGLTSEGALVPGPQWEAWTSVDGKVILDLVWDQGRGVWWIGTAEEGALWRVDRQGRGREVLRVQEPDVHVVRTAPDGTVYLAASPGGKIYRVQNDRALLFYETRADYVWDLQFLPGGEMVAATGMPAAIHRIKPDGTGAIWAQVDEPHLRTLAVEGFEVWGGTAGRGLVMRWDVEGRGWVVFETGAAEVVRLVRRESKWLVLGVGTAGSPVPMTQTSASAPRFPALASVQGLKELRVGNHLEEPTADKRKAAESSGKSSEKVESIWWSMSESGEARELGRLPGAARGVVRRGEDWIAVTFPEGHVGGVQKDDTLVRLSTLGRQVTAVGSDRRGRILVGVSGADGLGWLTQSDARPAVFMSPVVEVGHFNRWGRVRVEGEGKWLVRTRSGNTRDPDLGWHPWRELKDGRAVSPESRFLQVEIQMISGSVRRLEVFAQPTNRAPRVADLRVLEPGLGFERIPPQPRQAQPVSAAQLLESGRSGARGGKSEEDGIRFQPVREAGLRSVVWSAQDPDGDRVEYQVDWRRQDEARWHELVRRWEWMVFSWDTSGWTDGVYEVRVTPTDAPDNSDGEALRGGPRYVRFKVDHTPPELKVMRRERYGIMFSVKDASSNLRSVDFSLDGRIYRPLRPEDGVLDGQEEQFFMKGNQGSTVWVRVEDDSGNVAGLVVTF